MPATGRGRRRTAQTEPATPSPKRQCRPARFQEIFDAMRTYKDDSGELISAPFYRLPPKRTHPDYYKQITSEFFFKLSELN